jgi:hypothetical protein
VCVCVCVCLHARLYVFVCRQEVKEGVEIGAAYWRR